MLDVLLCHLVIESSEAPLCLCAENGCMYSFCGGDIFVMQMMFSINMLNTKVVNNFLIFLVLKLYDFRPASLGVIDFTNLLLAFACALNRSEWLYCLAYLNMESYIDDNKKVIYNHNKLSKKLIIMFVGWLELQLCIYEVTISFLSLVV